MAPVLLLLHAVNEKSVEYAPRRGSPAAALPRRFLGRFSEKAGRDPRIGARQRRQPNAEIDGVEVS